MRPRIQLGFRVTVLAVLLALPRHTTVARLLSSQHETGPLGVCPPVQGTPFFTIAYGTVTLDGEDAPVGTLVEAHSPRGDVAGCFEVTSASNYGMMYIYGEDNTVTPPIAGMRAGEVVGFYVNGSSATTIPTLVWANDKTWHQVELAAVGGIRADFDGTPRQGSAVLAVSFSNLSTGDFDSCDWDFGDGGTDTDCNDLTYDYTSPGTYTVTLTVSGAGGTDTLTRTDYITVYAPVVAAFTVSPHLGVAPLTVEFTNQSTGDYDTCTWDFGDGGTSTDCNDPSYTYESAGTYTVALTVSGDADSDTLTRPDYVTVYEAVQADFAASPVSGVAPLTVAFTNTSSGDYDACAWDFGDGGTSDDCNDPSYQYNSPGKYTVALTVSGIDGTDTFIRPNYIGVHEPVVGAFTASPTAGPAPLTVDFTNQSTGNYDTCTWDFGDGGTSTDCNDPSYAYGSAGNYPVTLTVSGEGGSDTLTRTDYVTVYEPVQADFAASPVSGVAPLTVAFTNTSSGDYDACAWDFGDGGTSDDCNDPSYQYTSPGSYTVALTVSGSGGTDNTTRPEYISVETQTHIYLPCVVRHSVSAFNTRSDVQDRPRIGVRHYRTPHSVASPVDIPR